jgi:hypothetical protein
MEVAEMLKAEFEATQSFLRRRIDGLSALSEFLHWSMEKARELELMTLEGQLRAQVLDVDERQRQEWSKMKRLHREWFGEIGEMPELPGEYGDEPENGEDGDGGVR